MSRPSTPRYLPLIAALLALLLPPGAAGQDEARSGATSRTTTEIDYLLDYVASSDCVFVRNGSDHDPADAADHLRLKYRRGKKYVNSADQFINRLASESSWSGKPYTVECGGVTEPTRDWLHRALADYRLRAEAPAEQAATADSPVAIPAAPD